MHATDTEPMYAYHMYVKNWTGIRDTPVHKVPPRESTVIATNRAKEN